jgi:hypothetical protein
MQLKVNKKICFAPKEEGLNYYSQLVPVPKDPSRDSPGMDHKLSSSYRRQLKKMYKVHSCLKKE